MLLQAECHYLNGDMQSADVAYRGSIRSAKEHQFLHYEALGCELYGIFKVENAMLDDGVEQLQLALKKYEEWGARRKVKDLQHFMRVIDPQYLRCELRLKI